MEKLIYWQTWGAPTIFQKLKIDHMPIESLNWPNMKMTFKVASAKMLDNIKVGQTVYFTLGNNEKGKLIITGFE